MDNATVFGILEALVRGWSGLLVRVKQDGVMKFMPIGEVRDQKLVYKIVRDLLEQSAREGGIIKGRP